MRSLTVTEAAERAAAIAVTSYDIDLDLTRGSEHFGSHTTIAFRSLDRSPTFLDVQAAEVLSITLNGTPIDAGLVDDGRLPLEGLGEENTLVVEALMAYSHDGEGLHRAVDPEDKQAYVYAMTFLPAAPRVFACFDQPDLGGGGGGRQVRRRSRAGGGDHPGLLRASRMPPRPSFPASSSTAPSTPGSPCGSWPRTSAASSASRARPGWSRSSRPSPPSCTGRRWRAAWASSITPRWRGSSRSGPSRLRAEPGGAR